MVLLLFSVSQRERDAMLLASELGAPPRALGTFAHVQSLPAQGAHMSTKDMIMLREGGCLFTP